METTFVVDGIQYIRPAPWRESTLVIRPMVQELRGHHDNKWCGICTNTDDDASYTFKAEDLDLVDL